MGFVALYCRLSPRPDGSYEGVDDQEKWGREYAAGRWPGLPVVVYADAGISAANGDHRPRFAALREAIDRGEVAHLWAVEQSRIERTEVGWFDFAAALDAAGIAELHTNRDGIVRVRDEVAGIKAVLNAAEVRKLKQRTNDRLAALAADGRPAGAHVFGYQHGRHEDGGKTLLVVEPEAAVIRDAADKVLAGWSLARIVAQLRERGVRGVYGGAVTTSSVQSMLTNATVAGWRTYKGRLIKGNWPAILDQETWEAVRDRLAAPRTVQTLTGGTYPVPRQSARATGRRYLLTGGIAVCGVCGAPLVASLKQLKGGRRIVPYYFCTPGRGGRSCVGIMAEPLEAYVAGRLFDELDKPEFLAALAEDTHAAERDRLTAAIRASKARRKTIAAQWGTGALDDDEYRAARDAQAETERGLREQLAAIPAAVGRVDVSMIREGWDAMNLDERREIVGMFVERVTVKPAIPGARRFNGERIGADGIVWRRS